MDSGEIKSIESELDIELPELYLELLLNYPTALLGEGVHASEVELLNSPSSLIELNKFVREANGIDIDASHFLIGESGCGDYYFIDLDEDESSVYFWNHDICDFDEDEESGSLLEHAGKLLGIYA